MPPLLFGCHRRSFHCEFSTNLLLTTFPCLSYFV
jgi:hypothetical protein